MADKGNEVGFFKANATFTVGKGVVEIVTGETYT